MNIVEYLKTAEFARTNEGRMDVRTYAMTMNVDNLEAIRIRTEYVQCVMAQAELNNESVLDYLNNQFRVYDRFDITFGQLFVFESVMYRDKLSATQKSLTLCQTFLRPKDEAIYDNSDVDKEQAHKKAILAIPAEYLSIFISIIMDKRSEFHDRKYEGVFYRPQREIEEEKKAAEEAGTKYDENDSDSLAGRDAFEYEYYWLNILDDLAKNNVLNYGPVMELDVRSAASWCAREKTRIKIENNEAKQREMVQRATKR